MPDSSLKSSRANIDIIDIDVVIPVFNAERYIKTALQSVISQTLSPKTIIIVDDASTDNTRGVIQQFVRRHRATAPVFKLLRRKKNRGPNASRNAGLNHCQSAFVAFLDADDSWQADKLQKQAAVFQNTELKKPGVIFCASNHIDEHGGLITNRPRFELDTTLRGNIYKDLQDANKISSSASGVLIKRNCFQKTGFFDENLRGCEDWDMWLRLARHFDFDFVNERLVNIRRHPDNNAKDFRKMLLHELLFWDKWRRHLKISPAKLNRLRQLILQQLIADFPSLAFYREIKKKISRNLRQQIFAKKASLFLALLLGLIDKTNPQRRCCQAVKHKFRSGLKYLYDKTAH